MITLAKTDFASREAPRQDGEHELRKALAASQPFTFIPGSVGESRTPIEAPKATLAKVERRGDGPAPWETLAVRKAADADRAAVTDRTDVLRTQLATARAAGEEERSMHLERELELELQKRALRSARPVVPGFLFR